MARIIIDSLDQEYNIRSGVDDDYLEELARHVDAKIKNICDQVPEIEPLKAAVFAALNIADEMETAKKQALHDKVAQSDEEKDAQDTREDRPALIIFDQEDVEALKRISSKTQELEEMLE